MESDERNERIRARYNELYRLICDPNPNQLVGWTSIDFEDFDAYCAKTYNSEVRFRHLRCGEELSDAIMAASQETE